MEFNNQTQKKQSTVKITEKSLADLLIWQIELGSIIARCAEDFAPIHLQLRKERATITGCGQQAMSL